VLFVHFSLKTSVDRAQGDPLTAGKSPDHNLIDCNLARHSDSGSAAPNADRLPDRFGRKTEHDPKPPDATELAGNADRVGSR
jgi:hypothetical protein